jgi:hypothetical protein
MPKDLDIILGVESKPDFFAVTGITNERQHRDPDRLLPARHSNVNVLTGLSP